MDAMECLLTRRSIRKYQPTPIPEEALHQVLEAALYAPSAINLQHWYFAVLQSPEKVSQFKEIMLRVQEKFRPVLAQRFEKHPQAFQDTETFLTSLGGAPVVVLVYALKPEYPDRDGAMQSISAALENLMLAAWAKGLGTCWISAPQRMGFGPELQETFASDKGEFVAAVTLGYPDQEGKLPPRREGRVDFF